MGIADEYSSINFFTKSLIGGLWQGCKYTSGSNRVQIDALLETLLKFIH